MCLFLQEIIICYRLYQEAVENRKIMRQPLALSELLNVKLATMRNKPEGGVFHPLFA